MHVTYHERSKKWPEGHVLLQQATQRLEEVLGPSADLVSAEWDRTEDERGQLLYTLKLKDLTEEVQANFSPHELEIPSYMRVRLYRLWGDLLKLRSDMQHRKVLELVGEQERG